MFKKNSCRRCGREIPSKYDFCPYCGFALGKDAEEDWGMLGKTDNVNANAQKDDLLAGSFLGGGILNKMLGSAMKMLEKELQKSAKEMKEADLQGMQDFQNKSFQPKTNLQIFINGKKVNLSPGKSAIVRKKSMKRQSKNAKPEKIKQVRLPEKELKSFSKFSKVEPETNIRRLSDRIVYEIQMPGVKSKKDISITRLESSIEIKAIAKRIEKAYYKVIKAGLPVINYKFSKETLVLELAAK